MKTSIIAFGSPDTPGFAKTEAVIDYAVRSALDVEFSGFEWFGKVRDGMPAIGAAVEKSDTIIILVCDALYYEAKRSVAAAFKFNLVQNKAIADKILNRPGGGNYLMQARLPENSTPFCLDDGVFPGFAIRSPEQCIMFITLSEDRTLPTFNRFVFPYIEKVFGVRTGRFSEYEASWGIGVFAQTAQTQETGVAIASTPFVRYISHAGKLISGFDGIVAFAPYEPKKTDTNTGNLSADKARDYYNMPYGMSVVEGAPSPDGMPTMVITVAAGLQANVRTIARTADETEDDFCNYVVMEAFLLLNDSVIGTHITGEMRTAKGRAKLLKKKYKRSFPVALFVVLIIIALIAAAVIWLVNSQYWPGVSDYLSELFTKVGDFIAEKASDWGIR